MIFKTQSLVSMVVPLVMVLILGGTGELSASPKESGGPWFASKDAIVTCMDIREVRGLGGDLASGLLQGLPMLSMAGMLAGADLEDIESFCFAQNVSTEGVLLELVVLQGDLNGSVERLQGAMDMLPVSAPSVRRLSNGVQAGYDDLDGTRVAFVVLENRVAIYGERKSVEEAVGKFRSGARVGLRGGLMGVRIDSMSPIVRMLIGAPSVVQSVEEMASVSDDQQRVIIVTWLRTRNREHARLVHRLLAEQRASQADPYSNAMLGDKGAPRPMNVRIEVEGNDVQMRVELPVQALAAAMGGSVGNLVGGSQVEL